MYPARALVFLFLFFILTNCVPVPSTPTPTRVANPTPTRESATPILIPPTATIASSPTALPVSTLTFVVTQSRAQHIAFIDPTRGVIDRIKVGASPWGIARAGNRLYVSTAQHVAIVDIAQRKLLAQIPYRMKIETVEFGEYRYGGMGIAAARDGKQIYVGVYRGNQPSQLEILDAEQQTFVASVPIGIRPFDVLVSRDDQIVTIDHDSYSVTLIDPHNLVVRSILVAPLGNGAYDKPHYAALDRENNLWLPYQGKRLCKLNLSSGQFTVVALTANTHQHGVAFTPDESQLLIVGTGAAGGASGDASVTVRDMKTGGEEIVPLARPHENIIVSPDGQRAFLTGGYLLGGWDGLTMIDLTTHATSELAIPDRPLDLLILP